MRSLIRPIAVLAVLCFALVAQAAGFDDGMIAFNNGDFKGAYAQWLPLAEKGDAQAQGMVGKMLFSGIGMARSEDEALVWFRRAAEQDNPIGQAGLGGLLMNGGAGLTVDRTTGIAWMQKAAAQGYMNAEFTMSLGFLFGTDLPRNHGIAKLFLQKALSDALPLAQRNDIEAQAYVAAIYSLDKSLRMLDLELDHKQVVAWLRNAADKGLPYAEHLLAASYEQGTLLPKDETLAAQWHAKAAEHNFVASRYYLSRMYRDGRGVEKDDAKALALLKQAADQRMTQAEYQLGMRYAEGNGVEKDTAQARFWLKRAGDRKMPEAKRALENLDGDVAGK